MLGVTRNPTMTPSDEIMKAVADDMGVGHTFSLTPVGVYFGEGAGVSAPDPFFGGVGPERTGCIECGECMTGCRHNAKNTLPKNYLGLAEKNGAVVYPLTSVTTLRPLPGGGYAVDTEKTGAIPGRAKKTFTGAQVVVAAGTYNTQKLLHRMKDTGHLHRLSSALWAPCRAATPRASSGPCPRSVRTTSRAAWRSRRRSIPTRTPTSNRSAMASAPT